MEEKLQTSTVEEPSSIATLPSLTQTGDKNTQVAHADNIIINNYIQAGVLSGGNPDIALRLALPKAADRDPLQVDIPLVNTEYYNLIVIGGQKITDDRIHLEYDRTIRYYIDDDIKAEYAELNEEKIAKLMMFPSVFASETIFTRKCNPSPSQKAYFGFVTGVSKFGTKKYLITFTRLIAFPHTLLIKNHRELAIGTNYKGEFEMHDTHWAVKRVNLIKELQLAGVDVISALNAAQQSKGGKQDV